MWVKIGNIRGTAGADGKKIEVKAASGFLLWRHAGGDWQKLISLDELKGKPGLDGKSIVDHFINNSGELVTTDSSGKIKNLGRIRGKPGKSVKGDPGRDGLNGIVGSGLPVGGAKDDLLVRNDTSLAGSALWKSANTVGLVPYTGATANVDLGAFDLTATNLSGALPESDLTFTDITTNNVTTLKHGFTPKLSGSADQFFNGEGNYVTPSGTAEAHVAQAFSSVSSVVVTHNFGAFPIVQVLDNSDGVQIPFSIIHSSINAFTVTFSSSRSGTVLATIGSPPLPRQIDIDADHLATTDDFTINVDTTSGDVDVTLYTISGNISGVLQIRKKVAANTLNIIADGTDKINSASTLVVTSQYEVNRLTVFSDEWGIT